MKDIPSNVLPYFIGIPVFLLFSQRAYKNYRRLHTPLSGYFALTGLFASIAFAFWSIPLAFTHNSVVLETSNTIGDFFLFALYAISAAVLYYLVLRGRLSKIVFMTPVIILCIIGWLADAYGYFHYGITVTNDKFTYKLPLLSSLTQIVLLVSVLLVGVVLFTKISEQDTNRQKTNLFGVAMLYILSAIAGGLNVLSTVNHSSTAVPIAYLLGFLIFVSVLIFVRLRKKSVS